jgi:hypothetical protein
MHAFGTTSGTHTAPSVSRLTHVFWCLTSDHGNRRKAGEETLFPRCEHRSDIPQRGNGEHHVLSLRIQCERRFGHTGRSGIERALSTAKRTRHPRHSYL